MLKITIVFGLVFVAVALGAPSKKKLVDIPPSVAKSILEATQKCVAKEKINEFLGLLREGIVRDDDEFKNIIGCSFVASGYGTKDGKVNVKKTLLLFAGKDDVQKIIIECAAKEDAATPNESLFNFYKCFETESPYTLNLSDN